MLSQQDNNILNRLEREETIYRIFPLKRFIELIKSKQLVLVTPEMWDDPFENFFLKANAYDEHGTIVDLSNLRNAWFGQCWTKNKDTDAMWRIYSPNKDGVRVKTTVGKLFDAIYDKEYEYSPLTYFIGQVEYKTKQELESFMKNASFVDMVIGGQNTSLAHLLLIKRDAFLHENEVRLLVNESDSDRAKEYKGLYKIPITNITSLIDEVCLDPRLSNEEYEFYQEAIKSLIGEGIPIEKSDLYEYNFDPIPLEPER